jgi:predicted secreted hydrolase
MTDQKYPTFTNVHSDMKTKPEKTTDSWYLRTNFIADGHTIGFEWHQMVVRPLSMFSMSVMDFLVMDATDDIYLSHDFSGKASASNGPAKGKCCVNSKYGSLQGDENKLRLDLKADDSEVHVEVYPRKVIHNGCTGLLPLAGLNSYQFSFPNADIIGTVVIRGKAYRVENAVAWFDRQWTKASIKDVEAPHWLWLGMNLNKEKTVSMSAWDVVKDRDKWGCFATIVDENDIHSLHPIDISYSELWDSKLTSNKYPKSFHVSIPTADTEINFTVLQKDPEFFKGFGKFAMGGSQALCKATGHYKDESVDSIEIVEVLGDFADK